MGAGPVEVTLTVISKQQEYESGGEQDEPEKPAAEMRSRDISRDRTIERTISVCPTTRT